MVKAVDIRLLGDKPLQRAFRRLPITVQRKLARKGLRAAGKIHLQAAKSAALAFSKGAEGRFDEPLMPKIAKGLKLRALKRSRRGFGVRIVTPTREQLGLGPNVRGYPPAHIELGAVHTSGKQLPALPFMRAPFDQNKEKMLAAIRGSLRDGLREEWDRGR